jgi:predicted DNA-binding protein
MVDTTVMRERLFTMRMSEEEHARLNEVSKHYGLNAAGTIRMLVKREHDGLSDARATKTPKKKPKR